MRAIVIGGGVAGTVAAIALRRTGAEVTVYEAYPDPAGDVGAFLGLAVNGLRGLDAIGCLDRVRRSGFPVPRQRMWSASGGLLGDVPRGRRESDDLHSVMLMRAHLVDELRAAAREAGVTLVTGERVTSVPGGIAFADGRTGTADLIVAADGIRSATRRRLDPHAPEPRYAGLYAVSGRTPGAGFGLDTGVYHMVFGRNGAFLYGRAPDGDVWWQAQAQSPTGDVTAELGALYRKEHVPAALIAAATEVGQPSRMHAMDPLPVWHDGSTVVIGDAAHPVGAGQGASMAIEDGLVLAACIAGAPTVAQALADYETARRPRITKMLKAGSDNRDAKKAGPVRRRVEAAVMRVVLRKAYARATAWLYDYEPPRPAARVG